MAKKQNLSYQDIESSLEIFKKQNVPAPEVGFTILKAFGKSDVDIRRYKEAKGVLTSYDGLLIKGLFGFQAVATPAMTMALENMKSDAQLLKAAPKIIAVSDGNSILAYDMRERESYENPLTRLYCDFAFFYPLCGVERFVSIGESPADVKAAEKLAKLHDELRAYNDFSSKSELHDLNIFIARLLFCFFAEDTGIFEDNLFTGSITRYTKEDASDLADYLDATFNVMDICERNADTMKIITQFPYVNGGLFANHIQIPKMSIKARKIILECGELNWQDINPDIFGSMIQAVVDPNVRANQGMHYTSVPNIMKVINPLFLDELREEYKKQQTVFDEKKRLQEVGVLPVKAFYKELEPIVKANNKLLARMSKMKFFDPACGSGNFLIIAYKMLRLLEMDILRLNRQCYAQGELEFIDGSCIKLNQFYGIELLDFPHEIAMLSMWLAEHQMNKKLHDAFNDINTRALPLHNITQIVCGNACRLDWNVVCPHTADEEVFVFGNPPYLGSKLQSKEQKEDIDIVFKGLKNSKILDYIAIWFYKGSQYIEHSKGKLAFVSTNSICQGEQVSILWPQILKLKEEILFAHTSFKWSNNAKYNAGVTVVVIGITSINNENKYLFTDGKRVTVSCISPYLIPGSQTVVYKKITPPRDLPKACFGCMPYDNGNLLFNATEYKDFIEQFPHDTHYLRRIYGSEEFINDIYRYCLWIDDNQVDESMKNDEIAARIMRTKKTRLASKDEGGRKLAEKPYQFREHPQLDCEKIIIPSVSSERRNYIPIGYLDKDIIISNLAFAIYQAPIWLFGFLTSKIHNIWVKKVGGYLGTSIRYSATICYNTFPFPKISEAKRTQLTEAAEEILITRAGHPEKTLADMYDPDKMPQDLREAHAALDDVVDSCYPGYPFANDEARLECLFKLYEKMTMKK